jgi:alpha-glucosidase
MSLISQLAVCVMVAALAIGGSISPATAAPRQWTVSQRDVSALVSLVDGVLRVGVTRQGPTVLAPAPVGLRTDGPISAPA